MRNNTGIATSPLQPRPEVDFRESRITSVAEILPAHELGERLGLIRIIALRATLTISLVQMSRPTKPRGLSLEITRLAPPGLTLPFYPNGSSMAEICFQIGESG